MNKMFDNNVHILNTDEREAKEFFQAAIVINLYYEEKLDEYLHYIRQIADQVDIFIFSSNEIVLKRLSDEYANNRNIYIKKKLNRGRDISALLVAFRPYIDGYEYICFLHDKKSKHKYLKEDLHFWDENLWGNMIFSNGYINRAIQLMKNENYGILLPPKPIGQYMDSMYIGAWNDDFDNVKTLASELQLNIDISIDDSSLIAIGSAFWCKVKALKKLFDYEWTYESFPDEPMPNDGTISHAIERIVGFVALDAGYNIGIIMNPEYAAKLTKILQSKLELTYEWLWKSVGIKNTHQLEHFDIEQKAIASIFENHQEVYLYGAGHFGQKYLRRLSFWGYQPSGYIVSDGLKTKDEYCGYKVYELSELLHGKEDFGIIVTTNPDLQDEIEKMLKNKGISSYYIAVMI